MKPPLLFLFLAGFLLPLLGRAEPITQEITLEQLGRKAASRVTGYSTEQSFFIPLPVANLDLKNSSLKLVLLCSSKLDTRSTLEVLVDDQYLGEARLNPGKAQALNVPLASLQGRWVPANFLKITLRAEMRHIAIDARCQLWSSRDLWFEIQPESGLRTTFDNQSPDWLSVARLPVTLRQEYQVNRNPDLGFHAVDLALKVRSWLAYIRPELESSTLQNKTPREPLDIFDFRPTDPGTPARVEVVADGLKRHIVLYGQTEEDASLVWKSLREISLLSVPGSSWRIAGATTPVNGQLGSCGVLVRSLDADFCKEMKGLGTLTKSFNFDSALFGRGRLSAHLSLKVRHLPVTLAGSGVVSLYINDRLLVSRLLPVYSDLEELDVDIPAHLLQEENQVRLSVHYNPTEEECKNPLFLFYYHIDDDALLQIREGGALDPLPDDLIRGARRYFARSQYQVVLETASSQEQWDTALNLVSWLQKVNARALLNPSLAEPEQASDRDPLVLIGRGSSALWQSAAGSAAILPAGEQLSIRSDDASRSFNLAPDASIGIIQFGYRRAAGKAAQPILTAYGWGRGGDLALAHTTAEMSSLGWSNFGNAVLGDGVDPLYSFDSNVMKVEVDKHIVQRRQLGWNYWRRWVVIPAWLLATGLAFWLLRPGKKAE